MAIPVIRHIVETSLRLRFLMVAIIIVLLLVGVSEFPEIPVDVWPELNPPLVEIQTEALGLAAAEVESLITVPMEADLLNGIAFLDHITSESVAGLSSIRLIFEPGTDPMIARQLVAERLTQAFALPNVSKPPMMLQPLSSTNRVMMIGLSSQDLSLIDLSVLARWNIRPRLMGVPGVANVAIWGQREQQLQVQVDPERLYRQGVTLQQIIETAGNALWVSPLSFLNSSTPGTAGWIDTPNQRLGLHHVLPIKGPEDLSKVSVAGSSGLRLSDVATVVEDHQPLIGDAGLSDQAGLLLVIERFPEANTLEVTDDVEEVLDALQPGLTGVEIDTIFRPASYIELTIYNLVVAALLAGVFIGLALFTFLDAWRVVFIGVLSILGVLLIAGLILLLHGTSINAMMIVGIVIAITIVIDDVVLDSETTVRRLRESADMNRDQSLQSVIVSATLQLRRPLSYATIIMLLIVLPVFFLPNPVGAFFRPLAYAYIYVLLAAVVVTLVITPMLSLILLSTSRRTHDAPAIIILLSQRYRNLLTRWLGVPRRVTSAVVITVLGGLLLLPLITVSLLPVFKQTDLLVRLKGIPGTSQQEMNRMAVSVKQEVRSIPGIRNVGFQVGRAITGDQVVGINSGELWISLSPTAVYEATVDRVRKVVDGYLGFASAVQTYQPDKAEQILSRAEQDLVVRVYGHELDELQRQAEIVQQRLAEIEGIRDVHAQLSDLEPQVEIEVDLAAAERYQIKPGDVRRQASTLLSGLQVGNLFQDQKVFDVVVWGVPELRQNLTKLQELQIDTPGGQVRLRELADVRIVPSPTIIIRDAVSRYIDVVGSVHGRDARAVKRNVTKVLSSLVFPLEYHAEVLDESAIQQRAEWRTLSVVGAVLVACLLLLQAAFQNWRVAVLFFISVPLALVGGLAAAILGGGTLTIGSVGGFLAVLAIVVRSGVVLLDHWQQLEQQAGMPFGLALVLRGSQERLTPILMSASAIGLAMLPLVLFGTIPGYELLHSLAIVTIGGLITSTLFLLFLLPALYLRFGKS